MIKWNRCIPSKFQGLKEGLKKSMSKFSRLVKLAGKLGKLLKPEQRKRGYFMSFPLV